MTSLSFAILQNTPYVINQNPKKEKKQNIEV